MSDPRKDLGVIAEQPRRPLVGLAAHEPVEVIEAHSARPLIEGAGETLLGARRVVVLAEPRRGIAVLPQDLADGGVVPPDDGVVARESGGLLGDHAEADRVMIAPGDQRRARRRAQRRGVELRVAQPRLRDPVQRRRRDDTAEGARDAVALVVGHDQQHVGRALGRHHRRWPIRLGVFDAEADLAAERWRRWRNDLPVNGRGGVGRTRYAGGLLRRRRQRREREDRRTNERRRPASCAHAACV